MIEGKNMPWTPYLPVTLKKNEKPCLKCRGTGMIRTKFGNSISDNDFWRCNECGGTGKEKTGICEPKSELNNNDG
jgi:DnaJ-class molecular chaperone